AACPGLGRCLCRRPLARDAAAGGHKARLPAPRDNVARRVLELVRRSPVPLPALAPALPVQFIHEADVGQAFVLCVVAAGPPGAYNITGDGVVTGPELARELGLSPIRV